MSLYVHVCVYTSGMALPNAPFPFHYDSLFNVTVRNVVSDILLAFPSRGSLGKAYKMRTGRGQPQAAPE